MNYLSSGRWESMRAEELLRRIKSIEGLVITYGLDLAHEGPRRTAQLTSSRQLGIAGLLIPKSKEGELLSWVRRAYGEYEVSSGRLPGKIWEETLARILHDELVARLKMPKGVVRLKDLFAEV